MYYVVTTELYHHGIKGQKWGIRRFQNEDGSLTAKGKKRYGEEGTESEKYKRDASKAKYLEGRSGINRKIHSRAHDIGYKKSKGKIIASGILKSMGVLTVSAVVAGMVGQRMTDNGNFDGGAAASFAISAIGGLAASSIIATHATAAIQQGRKKI